MAKRLSTLDDVYDELRRARATHAPLHSPHEGFAILAEEVHELWDEVRDRRRDFGSMRAEAVQVAAMAVRFIEDVCDGDESEDGHG